MRETRQVISEQGNTITRTELSPATAHRIAGLYAAHPHQDFATTIVPFHRLMPRELQHLGTNITDAIRLDHEELAADRSLTAMGEYVEWDTRNPENQPCA